MIMNPGLLVTCTRYAAFRVLVVLGPSRTPGKVRTATWSHNQRKWHGSQAYALRDLAPVELEGLKPSQKAAVRAVIKNVFAAGGWVNRPDGGDRVGKAFVAAPTRCVRGEPPLPMNIPKNPAITKLTPVFNTAGDVCQVTHNGAICGKPLPLGWFSANGICETCADEEIANSKQGASNDR